MSVPVRFAVHWARLPHHDKLQNIWHDDCAAHCYAKSILDGARSSISEQLLQTTDTSTL